MRQLKNINDEAEGSKFSHGDVDEHTDYDDDVGDRGVSVDVEGNRRLMITIIVLATK